ncbi:MAG TPA: glycosyl hydrolase 53 family protein [Chthoniobacteraceae bacterium]|jgi:arabinogalactan endo-1,4-beta-galactosidase|nr:glycosyl hydrolase 53 family protein [Chthoniobacteraceae bacterium]
MPFTAAFPRVPCLIRPWIFLLASVICAHAQPPADFAKGADLSLLQYLQDQGVQYRENGQPRDPLAIFKENGCNYVRLRLFVNPDGTRGQVNTLPYTIALAKRVKAMGLRFLLDFHYSDQWADPGHQATPAAWQHLSHEQLVRQVHDYTVQSLTAFRDAGCAPDMVQVGNEITNGMLWPDGGPWSKQKDKWPAFAELLKAGIRGVREAAPTARVMIHINNGGSASTSQWFFGKCRKSGIDYDVIGLSYYPMDNGPLGALGNNLDGLSATFGKDVYVAETAFDHETGLKDFPATQQGEEDYLRALIHRIAAVPGGRGKGFFYWAPEAIFPPSERRAAKRNARALFDPDGNMLPALTAFKTAP